MILKSFSGGQSKSKYHGLSGSWDEIVGLNIHDTPGLLKCSQALKKDSGETVTERVDFIVPVPSGDVYFFSGESGKIWKRTASGVWSLAHTNTNGACLGAGYHNGYLMYASASKLGRSDLTTWTDSWQDFANDDANYHPMTNAVLSLQIADGKYLAQVDNLFTYSSNALDIRPELRISCMAEWLDDVIIGATSGNYRNKSQIIRWNGYDDSWNYSDPLNEAPNAFIVSDNDIFFQAGNEGSIYYYNGQQGQHYGILRGETSIRATAEYKRRALIGGVSGIWSLGRYDKDYPQVLSVEFVPSCGTGATIGAIAGYGTQIFVAWKKTNCGVDIIDTSNKYSGYITSMVIDNLRTIKNVAVRYNDLPTGTSIGISSKKNNGDWTSHSVETDTYKREVRIKEVITDINTIQFKITLTASGNYAPEIESLIIE